MLDCGQRVAINFDLQDTEGGTVRKDEVGMVVGHLGDHPVVSLDHSTNSQGGMRIVVWTANAFRLASVARPGQPRRTRPRR